MLLLWFFLHVLQFPPPGPKTCMWDSQFIVNGWFDFLWQKSSSVGCEGSSACGSDLRVSYGLVRFSVCVCDTQIPHPPTPTPPTSRQMEISTSQITSTRGTRTYSALDLIFGIVFLEVKRCLNLFKVSASSSHSCINSDCVLTFVSLADRVWHPFYKKTISSGSSVHHSRSVWNRHERLWGSVHSVTHDLQMNQRHPVPENRTATGRKSGFGHCDVWLTEELWNPTETDRREREREWLTVYTVGVQGRASSRRDQKKENI